MPRVYIGYSHNFRVDSGVFEDDKSKTVAKTNSGHRVCPLLVRSRFLAYIEHAQSLLFVHYHGRVYTHTHTHTHKCT